MKVYERMNDTLKLSIHLYVNNKKSLANFNNS